jgi:serine protease AprX
MAKVTEKFVREILLDGRAGQRLLNESGVHIDVWSRFAEAPAQPAELLLMTFDKTPASQLAAELHAAWPTKDGPWPKKDRPWLREGEPREALAKKRLRCIAPLESAVAANLDFEDFVQEVLPRTGFELGLALQNLLDIVDARRLSRGDAVPVRDAIITGEELFDFIRANRGRLSPDMRVAVLVAVLLLVRNLKADKAVEKLTLDGLGDLPAVLGKAPLDLSSYLSRGMVLGAPPLIWRVALNRKVSALAVSVSTIKADAAHRVFDIDCRTLTWAVIDSGIDGSHPAFRDHDAGNFATRIDNAYDFSSLRKMASFDILADRALYEALLSEIADKLLVEENEAEVLLDRLRQDAEAGRAFDWQSLSKLLEVATDQLKPANGNKPEGHGTHVAGVLAGDWREDSSSIYRGVCPNIRLLDLRVLGESAAETEFAVIAALEFVRWLNARNRYMSVHGVNLSIGLEHDRDNYPCGRTPVCLACDATVAAGVSVVAAAGNWGAQKYTTETGNFSGYADMSIADPGNADSVITVGATHRDRPHEYGVSFFSSRGPTADGRVKPDVVAPGERIDGPLPDLGFGRLDGTSMAAPHVSGVAALLMARHPELIGKPRRVKEIIMESATSLGREPYFQGAGLVDALRALQRV